jgi:hypothetical protein
METMLTEIFFIFSIRSKKPFYQAKRPSLPLMISSILVIIGTIIVPYTAVGQNLFYFVGLDSGSLSFVFGLVLVYFLCVEMIKYLYYHSAYFKNSWGIKLP